MLGLAFQLLYQLINSKITILPYRPRRAGGVQLAYRYAVAFAAVRLARLEHVVDLAALRAGPDGYGFRDTQSVIPL